MSTIEKAMEKKEGEVTASTVLEQCIMMSQNKNIDAFYSYSGHIDKHHIYVNYKTDYSSEDVPNTIYNSLYSDKSLAEIYQDLIKIEEGEMK